MDAWTWLYEGYEPEQEQLREALCTLGNGRFATRGAAVELPAGGAHYPGTYAAGCSNRLVSDVSGHEVENEDMVNLPNWLLLRYRLHPAGGERGDWLSPRSPEMVAHHRRLDIRHGELTRYTAYRDAGGRELEVEETRIVSMADPQLAALRIVFTARGWSGSIDIESCLDGDVRNDGVARYRDLADRHLCDWDTGTTEPQVTWLRCRTTSSGIDIALAARTTVAAPAGGPGQAAPSFAPRRTADRRSVPIAESLPVTVEKTVALHTSRDNAISDPLHASVQAARRAPVFRHLRAAHRTAWRRLWTDTRMEVAGEAGRILRLHQFHLLQTLSPHTASLDAGAPARGLHGEAYRGHVFWDELFILPYSTLHVPDVCRALLDYRHRRLPQACRAARDAGYEGAMYPWQSGSDGREETQTLHLNPRSGRWLPDRSRLQRHVGSAVAYNIWHYAQATGDLEYLYTKGAEMLLLIARFWSSLARWDDAAGRYRITGVVGPDEYHDAYPGADEPGLADNAYTNVGAAWVLARALELVSTLPDHRRGELFEQLRLAPGELERWEDVSRRLRVPYHAGVISQFDGYGDLAELDWERYEAVYGNGMRRLDRVLEAEGDSVNRYRASKQADVLMLGYLFPPAELKALFDRLGCPLDDALWERTCDYYLRRTSHGSTLSSLVHAWVLAREHRADAWQHCREALLSDVADLQGGTTGEGIHLGAMAGTLDLVQRGLTGLRVHAGALHLDPAPLPQLSKFSCTVHCLGHWGVEIKVRKDRLHVAVPASAADPLRVEAGGRTYRIPPGRARWMELRPG
ncbi:glycoside hydrolase family 65 protein [Streptomyces sp. WMMB 322]|uniref:glycoside hydrolase family 65 protein n=1 Tax=Streptomyces sp. WMMB 322 TaxID=1286821 RepID=UPI0006E163E1|nr:glycosyl hydrolase family 65 protein [Streptomyces sp. WMMB 322]SCK15856.1 Trehalose and maltose hydrolase (possible phosphorylase) [Streptomyces sp. WMMB 322]